MFLSGTEKGATRYRKKKQSGTEKGQHPKPALSFRLGVRTRRPQGAHGAQERGHGARGHRKRDRGRGAGADPRKADRIEASVADCPPTPPCEVRVPQTLVTERTSATSNVHNQQTNYDRTRWAYVAHLGYSERRLVRINSSSRGRQVEFRETPNRCLHFRRCCIRRSRSWESRLQELRAAAI